MSHYTADAWQAYLRMHTQPSVKFTLFFDLKKYAHSEKIIPFSESTFKIYVMLGRALFLTLLAL